MKSLILGMGEIGSSLMTVLKDTYDVKGADVNDSYDESFEVLHVCYPYSDKFVDITKAYIEKYHPQYVVIHSTVPIRTTRLNFSNRVVHSPVRGKHPNIAPSLKTFVKYVGANDTSVGKTIEEYFNKAGIPTQRVFNSDNTEAAKLYCTTYYGWQIAFMQNLWNVCREQNLDFDMVYTSLNKTYNEGYEKMGNPEFIRPVLTFTGDGMGGHCVVENAVILKEHAQSEYENRLVKPILEIGKKK